MMELSAQGVFALQEIYTHQELMHWGKRAAQGNYYYYYCSAHIARERNIQMRRRLAVDKKREKRRRGGKTKVESSLKVVKVNPFLAARDAG
jgi:hypothetical protein